MDNIKPHRGQQGSRPQQQPGSGAPHVRQTAANHNARRRKPRHAGQRYWLVRSIGKVAAKGKQTLWHKYKQSSFAAWPKQRIWRRAYTLAVAALFLVSVIGTIAQPFLDNKPYRVSEAARELLPRSNEQFGELLKPNHKSQEYIYNGDYSGSATTDSTQGNNQPRFSASFSMNAGNGIKVSDKVNQTDVTMTPLFPLEKAKQEDNRILYKMSRDNGIVVYTSRTASVKEDIILEKYHKETMTFEFELSLDEGSEARLEADGSIGIYGGDLPANIAAGTENDAQLLQKVRQNAAKTKLLFQMPAPVVLEAGKKPSKATSHFELNGNKVKLITTKLDQANYPLSIDPTIYIETAAKLMRGNNETNVDFDVDNELIQKSQTTGARIDAWSSTNNLSTPAWGQGTAVAGGYIYSVAGGEGSASSTSYRSAGTNTYTVPAGVTSITVKVWGAGGGGGAGSNSSGTGGNGGGGGYVKSVLTVTPGETLDVLVGSAGVSAAGNSRGGNGGGFSALQRSGSDLLKAGGGGGGGGSRGNSSGNGGNGGAGGGTAAQAGAAGSGTSPQGGGGGAGTTSGGSGTGGAAGTLGSGGIAGYSGAANLGGNGGGYSSSTCNTTVNTRGGNSGTGGGGAGGLDTTTCSDGGGGGGGRYGGGGGGSTTSNNRGGGGGGGGSGYATGTSQVLTTGSWQTPANSADGDWQGAGQGGAGAANYNSSTNGADGAVVISIATSGAMVSNNVAWAKFDSTNRSITSPNPGTGACSGWCSNNAYQLPVSRRGMSLVAYNGYLYAMGGVNSGGTPQTGVYIAKIGANGEPQLWHPTDTNKSNWVYWYSDPNINLTNARSYFGAVAYNNKIYILGGLTTSSTLLSSNTVQFANFNPNGTLTTWSTSGMTALSSARYGLSAQVYNNTIYIIGGNNSFSGTPVSTVQYARLNSDGSMNSWQTTSSLTSGRQTMGGSFSTIFGGYIYVAGGCGAVNGSGYCTSMRSDVTLASINADGSLAPFGTMANITNQRMGHTLIAWQGGIYRLGGCRQQNASSGQCDDAIFDVDYGVINQTGEASTVNSSVSSGNAPCNGGSPSGCDLPGTATIGNMLAGAAIANGYLYILGGCTNDACSTSISNVAYQAIGSDGKLTRPATCPWGTFVDSYCVDTTNILHTGQVAASITVFGGYMYVVGGNSGAAVTNTIQRNSLNTDGSLGGGWLSQSMTGVGATAVSFTYAYARANPASASSVPGNLFIFGGCTGTGPGCNTYVDAVYKCNLAPGGEVSGCTTSGQLQIGTVPGGTGDGLAAHAGTVYANYIYLIGGIGNGIVDLATVRYAKFDNSNNVVAVTGSAWVESPNQMNTGRRRGAGFGYNGYIYIVGGFEATTGVLADIEFAKINVSDGSIGAFNRSSVSINQRWGLTVTVSNSYAYVIGGCTVGASPSNCTNRTDTIQTFQVYNNDSGTPVGYATDNLFATDRFGASSTIYNGYIYMTGGCTSSTDCTDATNSVQYAPIDAYGDIGTWGSTTALSADRAWGQLEVAGGTLYYIGGQNDGGTAQSTVYYAVPQSNGTITSWSTASNGLPAVRTQFGAAVWNDRIYVTGGTNGTTAQSGVYISPSLSSSVSGGNITTAWNSASGEATAFNVARSGHTTVAYANNLYILGGYDGSNYLSDTQYAPLGYKDGTIAQSGNTVTGTGTAFTTGQVGSVLQYPDGSTATITARSSGTSITVDASKTVSSGTAYVIMDGSVGDWTYSTSLPAPIRQGGGFAANGYIYLVGGRTSDTDCSPRTLVAPISANTTIATGNNPTGVGSWYETNVRYTGDRYGASVSYANGQLYVLGGACPVFPTITGASTSFSNDENTTNNVRMPSVVDTGDLLLVLLSTDGGTGSTVTTPGGWSLIAGATNGANVRGSVYARVAAGTEDGTNVNFATNNSEKSAANVYRIAAGTWRNSGTLTNDVEATGVSMGSTASPNPPSLNPANWNIENTLWFAFTAGSTHQSINSVPSNYGGNVHINTTTTNNTGANASSAYRNNAVASEDPGTFSMNNAQNNVAMTVAVRPASATGTGLTYTVNNRVFRTALYSQPQIAQYSRLIDTDSNVFPNAWLMNGLDNSIGARWQANYKSAFDSSNVTLHESFDGGSDGAGVQQSSNELAYDNCYNTAPGTNKYSNSQYITPGLSMRVEVPSGVGGGGACTDFFDYTTVRYERFYVRFDAFAGLSTTTTFWRAFNDNVNDTIAALRINTAGRILMRDGNTTTRFTSNVVPANTWIRVETAIYGDRLYMRTFEGANVNGTTPTQSADIQLTVAAADDFNKSNIGIVSAIDANWGAYFDDDKASSSNWVGPVYPNWGQDTNYGDVTMGDVATYTPKDAAGNNTQFSRWHFFWITIDASQTFGYPEDVNRGPTMSDLSLFFTADPNKRMRHGKTFVGGEQQPLDTPCRQNVDAQCPLPYP